MGQAKLRGTFEQRLADGIANRAREAQEQAERRAEYRASIKPDKRRRITNESVMFAAALALGNSR